MALTMSSAHNSAAIASEPCKKPTGQTLAMTPAPEGCLPLTSALAAAARAGKWRRQIRSETECRHTNTELARAGPLMKLWSCLAGHYVLGLELGQIKQRIALQLIVVPANLERAPRTD